MSGTTDGPVSLVNDRPCTRQYGQGPLPGTDPVRLEFIFAASPRGCEYQAICHRYIHASLTGSRPIRSGSELARKRFGLAPDDLPEHIPRCAIFGRSMGFRANCRQSGCPIHARPVRQDCRLRPYIVLSPALISPVSSFPGPRNGCFRTTGASGLLLAAEALFRICTNGIAMHRLTGNMKKILCRNRYLELYHRSAWRVAAG